MIESFVNLILLKIYHVSARIYLHMNQYIAHIVIELLKLKDFPESQAVT